MKFNRWLSIILVIIFSMTLAAAESNQIRFRRIQQPTARLFQQPRQIFIKPQPQQRYSLQKSSDLRRINQQPRPRPLSSSSNWSNLNKNPTSLSSTSTSSSWNTGRQKSERKVAWTPWSTPSSPSLFRSSSSTPKINVIDTGNTRQESWNQRASDDSPPGAYHWGYRWIDESGNQMFREETADGYGTVTGRYSFREYNGLIRIVEYIADENGYRTRIRSNEPGIVTSNPAGAQIIRFENENDIPA